MTLLDIWVPLVSLGAQHQPFPPPLPGGEDGLGLSRFSRRRMLRRPRVSLTRPPGTGWLDCATFGSSQSCEVGATRRAQDPGTQGTAEQLGSGCGVSSPAPWELDGGGRARLMALYQFML